MEKFDKFYVNPSDTVTLRKNIHESIKMIFANFRCTMYIAPYYKLFRNS